MKNLYIIVLSSVALFAFAPVALAGGPREVIEGKLGRVIELIDTKNEITSKLSEADRKEEVRQIVYSSFDFKMLSLRALSRGKNKFTDLQYDRFVNLFSDILFNTYYSRMRDYQVRGITYKDESIFNEQRAEVRTIVETSDTSFTIDYRLSKSGDDWRVYDVVIEGVSLVRNYRSQFSSILKSKSAEKLIEMLGEKVEKNN